MPVNSNSSADQPGFQRRLRSVVNSALWAAAGDAIGWITELASSSRLLHRAGSEYVEQPIPWRRMVGGRVGPKVDLPAGTYSDDTQLRLAVSRSIRGDGKFDVETFAKVELTVWPAYALGGGLGTKAAAHNLSRRSVNWFSNFYEKGPQRYITSGGNGAAMRVQPHVWCRKNNIQGLLLDVLRDSLVTHGHPHGFCGAVFHALVLDSVFTKGEVPAPDLWLNYANEFCQLSDIISLDPQLASFWRPAWEECSDRSLRDALVETKAELEADIKLIVPLLQKASAENYREILERLGCFKPELRGSGLKTALASTALAYLYRDSSVSAALVVSANELGSDTDTIATMCGAILGAVAGAAPNWPIQDREYIVQEAERLASITGSRPGDSFTYPDLARWNPPSSQSGTVGTGPEGMAIAGLGYVEAESKVHNVGGLSWQWFRLPFGQTIFTKWRPDGAIRIDLSQLPGDRQPAPPVNRNEVRQASRQEALPLENPSLEGGASLQEAPALQDAEPRVVSLDSLTDEVIRANFNHDVLGRAFNYCIEHHGLEGAIGFAAVIAKAKVSRAKRVR
ncbi:ADP-ribosylglycohydrolase family protein [Pseudomonas lopnurensis]|uniref:ADP-ribosylglycohydrolase family protein n=1 Tax=Pseudomonas lopnurensis TaxID=1477517 RepID=UPI0028A96224|nr:ADP-ribosylglycohydrolase family protein [Pseudomonas lopnurensis]